MARSHMIQETGKVLSNRKIKPGYYMMAVKCPSIAKKAKPGQFLTIRCGDTDTPLLRRPFGFHRIKVSGFEILYEIIGKGTHYLAGLKPGDKVDILGPLGNGFTVPKGAKSFVVIAGGIGVAPLASLAESLVKIKKADVYAIIGARNKKILLCEEHFSGIGIETMVATDDGSCGKRCFATDVLNGFLSAKKRLRPVIFACGPKPMLKATAQIAKKRGLECYVSLEENIACGVGACLGCAIKTRSGYKLVCKDGPVFNAKEVIW
ncbi:MAG: dihydroorotate dehydrogenase electron transfer subunit [Candidatus Omnitrophica bacterium]|nr:dihydroorotate dehydrogenase electron transfer subunit [Candidatus Omnitrophota bacterium]